LVDKTAIELKNFVTGANESGYHVIGALGEQFPLPERLVDVRKAGIVLSIQTCKARGIEVGHIFQLG